MRRVQLGDKIIQYQLQRDLPVREECADNSSLVQLTGS